VINNTENHNNNGNMTNDKATHTTRSQMWMDGRSEGDIHTHKERERRKKVSLQIVSYVHVFRWGDQKEDTKALCLI